jgi:hypothetical protein
VRVKIAPASAAVERRLGRNTHQLVAVFHAPDSVQINVIEDHSKLLLRIEEAGG